MTIQQIMALKFYNFFFFILENSFQQLDVSFIHTLLCLGILKVLYIHSFVWAFGKFYTYPALFGHLESFIHTLLFLGIWNGEDVLPKLHFLPPPQLSQSGMSENLVELQEMPECG